MKEELKHNDSNLTVNELKSKLNEKEKMIENLQNSQSVFLKNLSQNIRIPLNGIIGMIDVMKMTHVTDEQADYLNIIDNYGDNLIVIVNDILDYSKIIADELVFESKYFSLNKLKTNIEQSYRMQIEGKGLSFNLKVDPQLPQQIYCDEYRIFQIFSSLINNAIKFTKDGEINISFEAIELQKGKSNIRFTVEDSGFGMTKAKVKQIQSELNKTTKETIISTNGIGLGLSISQGLLRLMGGQLQFQSEFQVGSKFWFDLEFESRKSKSPVKQSYISSLDKKLSILLVEDNVLNQKFAVATLEKNGHQVVIAENGKIAFDKYTNGTFDLILMDVQMPVMDGVQATINIREHEKSKQLNPVKIVAVTAYAMDRDRERCLNSGMDKFLAKPFKPEQLMNIIDNLEFDT